MRCRWRVAAGRGQRVVDDAAGPSIDGVEDADAAVAEVDEVLGGGPGAAAVVDVDARDAGHRVLVDEDERAACGGAASRAAGESTWHE